MIIDWLEYVAKTKNDPTLHFTSSTNGWENTLYDIKTGDDETSTRSRKLVSELHPDAPYCEKLPLHDLDIENDKILCLRIFTEIRCGNLEEVQKVIFFISKIKLKQFNDSIKHIEMNEAQ